MSRYRTIALLDEISSLDSVRSYEPYLRALQQAVEALNDQSADVREALDPFCEPTLERRAWEILMQHLRPGQAVRMEDCFDIAERFAAEAAKRRGGQ